MKRCLLVGAAPSAHKELDYILQTQEFDAVYAVDGGFAVLQERDIVPDAVFGDFDSLGAVPQHPCVFEYDTHKDFTDMDLAIGHAEQHGFEELVICDAFTGRLDHSLGNLQLLIQAAARGTCVWGIGEEIAIAPLVAPGHMLGNLAQRCVPRRYRSGPGMGARRRNLHEPSAVGHFE